MRIFSYEVSFETQADWAIYKIICENRANKWDMVLWFFMVEISHVVCQENKKDWISLI
jgi:hypothetical protein